MKGEGQMMEGFAHRVAERVARASGGEGREARSCWRGGRGGGVGRPKARDNANGKMLAWRDSHTRIGPAAGDSGSGSLDQKRRGRGRATRRSQPSGAHGRPRPAQMSILVDEWRPPAGGATRSLAAHRVGRVAYVSLRKHVRQRAAAASSGATRFLWRWPISLASASRAQCNMLAFLLATSIAPGTGRGRPRCAQTFLNHPLRTPGVRPHTTPLGAARAPHRARWAAPAGVGCRAASNAAGSPSTHSARAFARVRVRLPLLLPSLAPRPAHQFAPRSLRRCPSRRAAPSLAPGMIGPGCGCGRVQGAPSSRPLVTDPGPHAFGRHRESMANTKRKTKEKAKASTRVREPKWLGSVVPGSPGADEAKRPPRPGGAQREPSAGVVCLSVLP